MRRELLDVALVLLGERGVDGLSMREVARRLGVSHQAPYKHFADREALLAALVEEGFRSLTEALDAACGELAASGTAYVRWALAHPGHFRLMFRPDLVALDRFPEARSAADAARARLDALVVGADDPAVDSALLWATVHGAATLMLDGPLSDPSLADDVPARLAAALGRSAAPRRR